MGNTKPFQSIVHGLTSHVCNVSFPFFPASGQTKHGHNADNQPRQTSISLQDLLPEDATYDQHRPPDSPTLVSFHVTVLTIDSIDEESMVKL
jgi:hypothetical protein